MRIISIIQLKYTRMFVTKVLLLFMCAVSTSSVIAYDKNKKISSDMINTIVKEAVNNSSKIMGLSGTILVGSNNTTIYTRSFGFVDMATKMRGSTNTQYLIGSVTKQFTAASLLKALYDKAIKNGISEHEIDKLEAYIQTELHKPISSLDMLPETHPVWDGSMPAWANKVTPHHLLTHSSGLGEYYNLPVLKNFMVNSPDVVNIVSSFKNQELEFKPGAKYSYSSSGYILLGEIVEQITGAKLDVYMESVLFNPAKMHATFLATTGILHEGNLPKTRQLARGYSFDASATKATISEVKYLPMQLAGAGGGIISTASDLLKWNNALYFGKIFPIFLVNIMIHPYMATDIENMVSNTSKMSYAYGMGVGVITSDSDCVYYTHGGRISGFESRLTYIPSQQLTIVGLSNIIEDWDKLTSEMEKIRAELPPTFTEEEKWQHIEQSIRNKYPNIAENKQRYDLMLITRDVSKELMNRMCQDSEVKP